ncbi:MAG: hypothetical protein H0T43_01550 [Solirubrobacterales bacterium]|nr:hypothetical protein [Solirubrobacterales bacterium]
MIAFIRTWLPIMVCSSGLLILAIRRDLNGLEAACALVGAGLSIWLLNFFYRVGVTGDRERDDEDAAREYFSRHGRWPDEDPPG